MYCERRVTLLDAVMLRGEGNAVGVLTPYVSGGLADVTMASLTRTA
jgi:hypothetical protein